MAGRKWTEEEIERLESMYGEVAVEVIARRLKRTVPAVQNMAGKRRLGRNRPSDVFSMHELQQILGMDAHQTVRRWIREGWLTATRQSAYGRADRPEWWIRERDFVAFLKAHPEQIVDADRVQLPYRRYVEPRWITFVEAFRRGAAWPFFLENAVKAGLLPEARKRGDTGTRWVVPETMLPRLIEARRRMTTDAAHRGMVLRYNHQQARGAIKSNMTRLNRVAREKAS